MAAAMPFCPECASEYQKGFTRCADCDVELTDAPVEKAATDPPSGGLTPLLTTTRIHEAYVARAILEENGIEAFIENEHASSPVLPTAAIPVVLAVRQEDGEQAAAILRETPAGPTPEVRRGFGIRLLWILGLGALLLIFPVGLMGTGNMAAGHAATCWTAVLFAILFSLGFCFLGVTRSGIRRRMLPWSERRCTWMTLRVSRPALSRSSGGA